MVNAATSSSPAIVEDLAQDEFQQVILSWLSKDHAVYGQCPPERNHPVRVPRQRQDRRSALNPCVTFCEHPVRDEPTVVPELVISETVGQLPRGNVFGTCDRGPGLVDRLRPNLLRDILPDGVTVIAVDTALALFEVNWIRGEIPVHHGVAVPVKSKPSCPMEVVPSTNGQRDELKAARTASRC